MIEFVVSGPPVGKERPRRGKGGVWYTPQKSLDYEARIRHAFQLAWAVNGRDYVGNELSIDAYVATGSRPDIDNILKCVLDGLQGVAYANDRQVTAVAMRLHTDKAHPRLEVVVY